MDFFSYLQIVNENIGIYILIWIFSFITVFYVLKKQLFFIIDPFLVPFFFFSIHLATVLFMYYNNLIENISLYHFLATFSVFLIGLSINGSPKYRKNIDVKFNIQWKLMYYFIGFVYFFTTTYLIMKYGVPLFSGVSRIGFYAEEGVIKKISDMGSIALIFFLAEKFTHKKEKLFDKVLLLFLSSNMLVSGSKSGILFMITAFSVYFYYFTTRKITRNAVKYLVMALVGFLIIVFVISGFNLERTLTNILVAFANRSDMYVYFYGAGYENMLHYYQDYDIADFIIQIFRDVFLNFRIISYESNYAMESFSDKLYWYVYGSVYAGGPNNIYNLFSLAYLGFIGSLIYSFTLGYFISFIRNKCILYFNLQNLYFRQIFFCIQIGIATSIFTIHSLLGSLFLNLVFLGILYFISYIVCLDRANYKSNESDTAGQMDNNHNI